MCLAVPARIITIDGFHAWAETMGIRQKVNIQLIDSPVYGDYILVHAGFAIEKIDPEYFQFLDETLYAMLEGTELEGMEIERTEQERAELEVTEPERRRWRGRDGRELEGKELKGTERERPELEGA